MTAYTSTRRTGPQCRAAAEALAALGVTSQPMQGLPLRRSAAPRT